MDEVVFLRNSSHLGNGVNISYTLLTNRKYSTYFEVTTAAGMINISHDTFSKISLYIYPFIILIFINETCSNI